MCINTQIALPENICHTVEINTVDWELIKIQMRNFEQNLEVLKALLETSLSTFL